MATHMTNTQSDPATSRIEVPTIIEGAERRLYVWTNSHDKVVAYDLADVQAVVEAQYGSTFEEEGWSQDDWERLPDDRTITITNYDDNGGKLALTAKEWIERDGRCFLCSTDF
jgi:hypothetical protein